MDTPLDILAFAPHPDDAEIGCAGSLIRAAQRGQRVAVADLTAGEGSSRGEPWNAGRRKPPQPASTWGWRRGSRWACPIWGWAAGRSSANR